MKTFKEYINEARPSRKSSSETSIMNASSIWSKGKISKKDFNDMKGSVIFLGTKGNNDIAIIGSFGNKTKDPFEAYDFKKGERIRFNIDTGNGYRNSEDELKLNSFVTIDKEGNIVGEYEDKSYSFWVFK